MERRLTDDGTDHVGVNHVLLGRAAECAMLDKLATDVRRGFSGSMVFTGEPGVGKTRLLQYMAGSAADVTIGWVAGAQSELRLGFAALHRLVLPGLNLGGDGPSWLSRTAMRWR